MLAKVTSGPRGPEPEGRLVPSLDGESLWVAQVGEGRPLVMLGGGGGGTTAWVGFGGIAEAFADDHSLVFLDPLMYGQSTAGEPESSSVWTRQAAHVAAVLKAIGVVDADVMGISIGSTIALALAADYPELIRSLIVTGAEPVMRGRGMKDPSMVDEMLTSHVRYYGNGGPSPQKMKDILAIPFEWYDKDLITDELMEARYQASLAPGLRERALNPIRLNDREDLEEKLGAVKAEVLFIYGRHDPFVTDAYLSMLTGLVEHGSLYIMDKGSHHIQHERPELYASIVKGFLASISPSQ